MRRSKLTKERTNDRTKGRKIENNEERIYERTNRKDSEYRTEIVSRLSTMNCLAHSREAHQPKPAQRPRSASEENTMQPETWTAQQRTGRHYRADKMSLRGARCSQKTGLRNKNHNSLSREERCPTRDHVAPSTLVCADCKQHKHKPRHRDKGASTLEHHTRTVEFPPCKLATHVGQGQSVA